MNGITSLLSSTTMRSEKSLASASKSLKSSDITSCSVRLTLILVLFTVEQKKMSQFEMFARILEWDQMS